jgi:hypothetical protein
MSTAIVSNTSRIVHELEPALNRKPGTQAERGPRDARFAGRRSCLAHQPEHQPERHGSRFLADSAVARISDRSRSFSCGTGPLGVPSVDELPRRARQQISPQNPSAAGTVACLTDFDATSPVKKSRVAEIGPPDVFASVPHCGHAKSSSSDTGITSLCENEGLGLLSAAAPGASITTWRGRMYLSVVHLLTVGGSRKVVPISPGPSPKPFRA